jgi:hypothetical protein
VDLRRWARGRETAALLVLFRVGGVGGRATYLHAYYDSVQIQDGLPVLPENVETDVAFEIDVGVVDLLCALYFWGVVGVCDLVSRCPFGGSRVVRRR